MLSVDVPLLFQAASLTSLSVEKRVYINFLDSLDETILLLFFSSSLSLLSLLLFFHLCALVAAKCDDLTPAILSLEFRPVDAHL